jgi:hypothetical protein
MVCAALTLPAVVSGCGSEEAPAPNSVSSGAATETPPTELPGTALQSTDYVGLEDGNISFHLHWVNGPINKEGTAGAAPADLETVRTAAGQTFDRVMFRFVGAELPGYEVAWTAESSEGCAGGSAPPAGAKHLRVRFRPANSPGRITADVADDMVNIDGAAQTCAGGGAVEWHVAMSDSSQVRVLEMRQPPRLIVDVKEPDRMPTPVRAP